MCYQWGLRVLLSTEHLTCTDILLILFVAVFSMLLVSDGHLSKNTSIQKLGNLWTDKYLQSIWMARVHNMQFYSIISGLPKDKTSICLYYVHFNLDFFKNRRLYLQITKLHVHSGTFKKSLYLNNFDYANEESRHPVMQPWSKVCC